MPKTKTRRTHARLPVSLPPIRAYSKETANLADPPFWPTGHRTMTFLGKVEKLAVIAPAKVEALHTLVDSVLREEWWAAARTQDGLALLAHLTDDQGGER